MTPLQYHDLARLIEFIERSTASHIDDARRAAYADAAKRIAQRLADAAPLMIAAHGLRIELTKIEDDKS